MVLILYPILLTLINILIRHPMFKKYSLFPDGASVSFLDAVNLNILLVNRLFLFREKTLHLLLVLHETFRGISSKIKLMPILEEYFLEIK